MNETTLELLKPIMIDFEKLKVGDEVWDVTRGASKIAKLEKGWQYPITVEFYNPNMEFHEYSYKGHSYEDDPHPSLYLQDPFDYLAGMVGDVKTGEEWKCISWKGEGEGFQRGKIYTADADGYIYSESGCSRINPKEYENLFVRIWPTPEPSFIPDTPEAREEADDMFWALGSTTLDGKIHEAEEHIYPIPNLAYYKKIAGELDRLFNRLGCKKLEKK